MAGLSLLAPGDTVTWQALVREWPRETVTRAGTVWSDGPSGVTGWWVLPDACPSSPVLVRTAGRAAADRRAGWEPGDLVEVPGAAERAASRLAAAERARAAGGAWRTQGGARYGTWHVAPRCPAADGGTVTDQMDRWDAALRLLSGNAPFGTRWCPECAIREEA